tara:strand:- start:206 stop:385 length:180 start_codon:yes stop_codon:yes gene_type:complete
MSFFEWLVVLFLTAGMLGIGKWFESQEEKNPKVWKKGSSVYYQIGTLVVYIYILYNLGY